MRFFFFFVVASFQLIFFAFSLPFAYIENLSKIYADICSVLVSYFKLASYCCCSSKYILEFVKIVQLWLYSNQFIPFSVCLWLNSQLVRVSCCGCLCTDFWYFRFVSLFSGCLGALCWFLFYFAFSHFIYSKFCSC